MKQTNKLLSLMLCCRYQRSYRKKPMSPHNIPPEPFQMVATNVFAVHGNDYLVIVNYFSKCPQLCALTRKTASTAISHLKATFAGHGIPQQIVSNNMPFTNREFARIV